MKKIVLSAVVIIALGGYALWRYAGSSTNAPTATNIETVPTTSVPPETVNSAQSTSQYKDGTYVGSVANAFYGNLQVSATISDGMLTDVTFLQYPNDQPNSVAVNTHSNPILKSEAIAAQSANVDIVSGATQSSEAFQQSLGDALSQAQS